MDASTYVNFNGQCEEAFAFYARACGGNVTALMRWADMPGGGTPPEMAKKVMHANLKIGATAILGADAPPDRPVSHAGFNIALNVDSTADAERIFAALSDGGNVTMPIAETFFAHRFGMVTDRYSVPWMIIHGKA